MSTILDFYAFLDLIHRQRFVFLNNIGSMFFDKTLILIHFIVTTHLFYEYQSYLMNFFLLQTIENAIFMNGEERKKKCR